MKKFYRMFRRGHRYYVEHVGMRQQTSLGTSKYAEALRLWSAKNEALQAPVLNLAPARTYLSAHDPRMIERTWADAIVEIVTRAKSKSRARYERAMRDPAFKPRSPQRVYPRCQDAPPSGDARSFT